MTTVYRLTDTDRVRTREGYSVTWGYVEIPEGNLVRPMEIVEVA